MMRFKCKGVTIAATAIAIIAWMFLGYIAFIVMASPFSVLASARTARQAEQYAEFVASSLRLVSYDELDTAAHGRRSLAGEIADAADWESSVTLSDERHFGDDAENVQRIATVDIFRTGDTLSRYTLQVPLSSAYNGSGGGYNTLVTITESCNWEAPVTGWYKFSITGAGGGGAGGYAVYPGSGGGGGGTSFAYEYVKKGQTVYIIIGKGGNGGAIAQSGEKGEDSIISVNGKNYIGYGGAGGGTAYKLGFGGDGHLKGLNGSAEGFATDGWSSPGGSGGGNGGNGGGATTLLNSYVQYQEPGHNGEQGFVFIEFFDPKKK